jgi:hypothetical protein
MEQAACKGMADNTFAAADPFFPEPPSTGRPLTVTHYAGALIMCAQCPVKEPCARDAIQLGDMGGVRGGMMPAQLLQLARRGKDRPEWEAVHERGWSDRVSAEYLGVTTDQYRGWRTRRGLAPNYLPGGSGGRVSA